MSNQEFEDKDLLPSKSRIKTLQKKGQIPRSKELVAFSVIMGSLFYFLFFGWGITNNFLNLMTHSFSFDKRLLKNADELIGTFYSSLTEIMMAFICFSVFVFIVVFLSSIAVGGWNLSLEKTKFNLKNISPIEGVKRIFSFNNLFECIKSILKITVVIVAFCFLAKASYLKATSVGTFFESAQLLLTFTLTIAGSLVIIVLIDIPYQLWQHLQNSKMSRRELQDELKESELSREQKQRLREHSDQNIRKDNRGKEWMIS